MDSKLYIATLFYPSVKSQKRELEAMLEEIKLASGNRYRALAYGEHTCAIGFETDIEPGQLHSRFANLGTEFFSFLLIEVAAIPQGSMYQEAWQWLYPRLRNSTWKTAKKT